MPANYGGQFHYEQGERQRHELPLDKRAEGKPGHKPLHSYKLPRWVQHPDLQGSRKVTIEKKDYLGMAVDGSRNYECWNVAHVAAFHDDLKMLSLATREQCMEPNKWGMTPLHLAVCSIHPYGPALCVVYELVKMGVADVDAVNCCGMTAWDLCKRMHKVDHLKMFGKVLYTAQKPPMYDERRAAQMKPRGKFAKKAEEEAAAAAALAASMPQAALPPAAIADGPPLPVCLLFPGQGSQYVGMMKALKDLATVKPMLETAKRVLGYDLLDVCLNGPEEQLGQTKFCQPAMFVAALAAVEQLKQQQPEKVLRCRAVAGLSLGEYTALTVAGVFDFETGLKLVKARAEAMEHEVTKPDAPKQAMLSVAGMERSLLEKLCAQVIEKEGEVCQIANHLFPKGFAVAGTEAAVLRLEPVVKEAGALQAKLLKTAGAFHTSLMHGAQTSLLETLRSLQSQMQPPRCQVYMNVTGKTIGPDAKVEDIVEMLGQQLVSGVLWEQSMTQAIQDGMEEFFECGPNKQLKAMMKRINQPMFNKTTSVLA